MGLKANKISIKDEVKESAIPRKANYVNKDLPLTGVTDSVGRWQRKVLPTLFAWASTIPNAFDINGHPSFKAVLKEAWDEEFEGEADYSDVVFHVVC